MTPTPLALKNQLLSGSGDLRTALEVCEKVVEMLKVSEIYRKIARRGCC